MFLQIIFIFCLIPNYIEPAESPSSASDLKRTSDAGAGVPSPSSSKGTKVDNKNDEHYKNGPIKLGHYPLFEPKIPKDEAEKIVENEIAKVKANIELNNNQHPLPWSKKIHLENEKLNYENLLWENELSITGQGHSSKHLTLDRLNKPIRLNRMHVPKWHEGHFLVCRLLKNPRIAHGHGEHQRTMLNGFTAINLLIADFDGSIEQLELYNFVVEPWMQADAIIVIKEPYLKYFIPNGNGEEGKENRNLQKISLIRVESPSDILVVPRTDREQLERLGAELWYKKEEKSLQSLWDEAKQLQKDGKFEEAIMFFDRYIALKFKLNESGLSNVDIHLEKASTLLHLKRFYEANLCADKAHPMNRKRALMIKGKAAYGQLLWEEALGHFQTIQKEFQSENDDNLEEWLKKIEKRLMESKTGEYDFYGLYNNCIDRDQFHLDVADYIGPIKITQIPNKGRGPYLKNEISHRGMVTTRKVEKGTMLMATKGYCYNSSNRKAEAHLFLVNTFPDGEEALMSTQVRCIFDAIQKLKNNPQTANELYSLYSKSSDEKMPEEGIIDTARIQRIFLLNNYNFDDMYDYKEDRRKYSGLFIQQSFVNHACLPNTSYIIRGDVLFMYAVEDMEEGQEVTIYYNEPEEYYEERQDFLSTKWGIDCDCIWCKKDAQNPRQKQIEKLLKEYRKIKLPIIDDPLNANLGKQLEKMVEKLQKLYTTNDVNNGQQFLRLHLNGPLSLLGYIYFHKHQYDKVEKILLEALASLEGTPQKYFLHPTIHILLVQVYMKQQKMAEARKIGEDAFQLSAIKEGLNDKRLFLKLYPTFDGLI